MKRISADQEYDFTPQAKGAACGTCKRFSYRLNTCTRIGEQRAPINIACDKYEERPEGYQHPADVISVDDTATETAPVATQKCNRCGKELPLTDFARLRGETRHKTCRKCMGELASSGRKKKAAKKPQRKKKDYEAPSTEELPSGVGTVLGAEAPVEMRQDVTKTRPAADLTDGEFFDELRARGYAGKLERMERKEYDI